MNNENIDMDSMITTFNTAVTEAACKILGKLRQKKTPESLQTFLMQQTEKTEKEQI